MTSCPVPDQVFNRKQYWVVLWQHPEFPRLFVLASVSHHPLPNPSLSRQLVSFPINKIQLFNNDKVHNNTNALSATTDMHSWLEYDYFFCIIVLWKWEVRGLQHVCWMYLLNGSCIVTFCLVCRLLHNLNSFVWWTLHTHTNLAPGCLFQICQSVSMKSPVRCIYLWLIYSAGVSSCSCSGLLCWKLKFKRTNFITWKCFWKLEIPYCRYTTGWRYFLLSTAPVHQECIRLFRRVAFPLNSFLTLVEFFCFCFL